VKYIFMSVYKFLHNSIGGARTLKYKSRRKKTTGSDIMIKNLHCTIPMGDGGDQELDQADNLGATAIN